MPVFQVGLSRVKHITEIVPRRLHQFSKTPKPAFAQLKYRELDRLDRRIGLACAIAIERPHRLLGDIGLGENGGHPIEHKLA